MISVPTTAKDICNSKELISYIQNNPPIEGVYTSHPVKNEGELACLVNGLKNDPSFRRYRIRGSISDSGQAVIEVYKVLNPLDFYGPPQL